MIRCRHIVLASILSFYSLQSSSAGFDKAKTLLESIVSALTGISLITVTLATLWVGYKVLFGGRTLRECAPIIVGAILIASASEIAKILVV